MDICLPIRREKQHPVLFYLPTRGRWVTRQLGEEGVGSQGAKGEGFGWGGKEVVEG